MLADQGFNEVTLLGQNVNSYHDASTQSSLVRGRDASLGTTSSLCANQLWLRLQSDPEYVTSRGFSNLYQLRDGDGVRFAELLDRLSL